MQLKSLLIVILLLAATLVKAQQNEDVINYVNTYKALAMEEMQRTGVPAAITLAQGIHETMAGKSDLVKRSNNHFGIKCKNNWSGERVYHDDDARGECFRSYPTAADSYRDHSDFLKNNSRYASLFSLPATDYKDWAYGLKKAGYATNRQYPQILIKLIEDYNLEQYTLIAMGRLSPDDEVLAGGAATRETVTMLPNAFGTTAPAPPPVHYPPGEFEINRTRVVYIKAGTPLLVVAKQYDIPLGRLLDFNDIKGEDVLVQDQLIFLRRKRKTGANDFHIVQPGETLYDIGQAEGIRLKSLAEYNHLEPGEQPAYGEKLYLQDKAPARPRLASETAMAAVSANTTITPAPASSDTTDQPTPVRHIVRSKETLYAIARQYGVAVEDIRNWNHLSGYDLKVGQELVIYKN